LDLIVGLFSVMAAFTRLRGRHLSGDETWLARHNEMSGAPEHNQGATTAAPAIDRVVASLRENAAAITVLVGVLSGLASVFAYGCILRYQDSAMAAAGWPGLSLPSDKPSALARALVGGVIFLLCVAVTPAVVYVTSRHGTKPRGKVLVLWALALPAFSFVVGILLFVSRSDISTGATLLVVNGIVGFLAWVVGVAVGGAQRVRSRRNRRERHPIEASPPQGRRDPLLIGSTGVLIVAVLGATALTEAEVTAKRDVVAIRHGEQRDVLWELLVPLDLRLVQVRWIDPQVRAAFEPVPAGPFLLVGQRAGRTLLVEANAQKGHSLRRMEIPDAAVALDEP
ncbi:MAG: hypothetical protein M3144_09970, partial [Actinomycetota bacterium]|nr:hypothetical protein [Actinomycetota bacterium]